MKENKNRTYASKYRDFYNSTEWKALRNLKFAEADGLCEECKAKGIIEIGKEAHHIKPIASNWEERYNYSNLILLCSNCHNAKHNRISSLQKFNEAWENLK